MGGGEENMGGKRTSPHSGMMHSVTVGEGGGRGRGRDGEGGGKMSWREGEGGRGSAAMGNA
jgi:hypothetical protein